MRFQHSLEIATQMCDCINNWFKIRYLDLYWTHDAINVEEKVLISIFIRIVTKVVIRILKKPVNWSDLEVYTVQIYYSH